MSAVINWVEISLEKEIKLDENEKYFIDYGNKYDILIGQLVVCQELIGVFCFLISVMFWAPKYY